MSVCHLQRYIWYIYILYVFIYFVVFLLLYICWMQKCTGNRHTHTHTYIHMNTHVSMYVYSKTSEYILYRCVYLHTYIHIYLEIDMCVCIYKSVCVFKCMYVYTYLHLSPLIYENFSQKIHIQVKWENNTLADRPPGDRTGFHQDIFIVVIT